MLVDIDRVLQEYARPEFVREKTPGYRYRLPYPGPTNVRLYATVGRFLWPVVTDFVKHVGRESPAVAVD